MEYLLYRGSHAPPDVSWIRQSDKPIYFGDTDVANAYASGGRAEETARVYPCLVTINKPFVNQPNNPFLDLDEVVERFGLERAIEIAIKFSEWIYDTSNWQEKVLAEAGAISVEDYLRRSPMAVEGLYFSIYPYLLDLGEVSWLKSLGYDGAIHGGSGIGSACKAEYCAFDKRQIKSIYQ